MKRVHVVGIAATTLLLWAMPVASEIQPKVSVNGTVLAQDAVMIGERVYVPLRAVGESLGAAVSWDSSTDTAIVNTGGQSSVTSVIQSATGYVVGIIGQDKNEKYTEAIMHGTGFILSPDGEIVTNAHVVKDMETILVVLSDGTGYEGTIKCIDEDSDIALVQIAASGLPCATISQNSEPEIGSTVIAIGTPISFSLRNSASVGIISGINRSVDSYYRLLQTDATINMGNSGGPLLDLNGEVVGMNTVKYTGYSIEGLGFSISADTLRYVLGQFRENGRVLRPYLGAEFEESWIAKYDLPSNDGLTIVGLAEGSPAATQGLQRGDSVLSIDGVKLGNIVDYHEVTKKYRPGDSCTMQIRRDGVIMAQTITFGVQ